jgi:outer membrane protein TolC
MKAKLSLVLGLLVLICLGGKGNGFAAPVAQGNSAELSQEEAIALALSNNARIKAAASQLGVSQALIEYEKSKYYPKFNFMDYPGLTDRSLFAIEGAQASGNFLTTNNRLISGNRAFNHMETRMTLPVVQDGIFGLGSHKIAKAKFTLEQSKFMSESTKLEIISGVKNLFLAAQKAQLEKDLFQESVSNYQSILQLVKEKFNQNLASQKDVLLAEAGLATAQAELATADHEYQKVLKELFLFIGESQSKGLRLTKASPQLQPLPPWDQVAHKIPANNLELKAKQLNINIAQEDLALSKTKLYPSVDLIGRYFGSTSSENQSYSNSYAAYFFVQLPLFEYPLYKDVSVKNQELTLASDTYRVSSETVLRDGMEQYKELQNIGPRLNSIQKQVLYLKENYDVSLGKYRMNLISFIELANAQLLLHEANKNMAELYFKHQIGYRKLQTLMGEQAS